MKKLRLRVKRIKAIGYAILAIALFFMIGTACSIELEVLSIREALGCVLIELAALAAGYKLVRHMPTYILVSENKKNKKRERRKHHNVKNKSDQSKAA